MVTRYFPAATSIERRTCRRTFCYRAEFTLHMELRLPDRICRRRDNATRRNVKNQFQIVLDSWRNARCFGMLRQFCFANFSPLLRDSFVNEITMVLVLLWKIGGEIEFQLEILRIVSSDSWESRVNRNSFHDSVRLFLFNVEFFNDGFFSL